MRQTIQRSNAREPVQIFEEYSRRKVYYTGDAPESRPVGYRLTSIPAHAQAKRILSERIKDRAKITGQSEVKGVPSGHVVAAPFHSIWRRGKQQLPCRC